MIRDTMNDFIWKKDEEKTDDYPDYYGCVIMIVDERIRHSSILWRQRTVEYENIEREALDARVPIIRKRCRAS